MQSFKQLARCAGLALAGLVLMPVEASARINRKTFLAPEADAEALAAQAATQAAAAQACKGKTALVDDIAFEGAKTTQWNFASVGGGGIGGRFDPMPVLSTSVNLRGGCLDAHFSAMGGSTTYDVSNMTMFEITLTPAAGGAPMPMVGHYPTPYGVPSPASARNTTST